MPSRYASVAGEPTQTSRGGSASACDTFGVYAAGSTQDGMTTTWRAVRDGAVGEVLVAGDDDVRRGHRP